MKNSKASETQSFLGLKLDELPHINCFKRLEMRPSTKININIKWADADATLTSTDIFWNCSGCESQTD